MPATTSPIRFGTCVPAYTYSHAFPGARAYPRARARLCVWRLPLARLLIEPVTALYSTVYVAQRTQMSAAVHRPNRAQMGPSGEIARMAHLTQPMPIDRVRGRSRTRISPQPGCTGPTGRSTEIHGVSEAQNGFFGGFRGSKNST